MNKIIKGYNAAPPPSSHETRWWHRGGAPLNSLSIRVIRPKIENLDCQKTVRTKIQAQCLQGILLQNSADTLVHYVFTTSLLSNLLLYIFITVN